MYADLLSYLTMDLLKSARVACLRPKDLGKWTEQKFAYNQRDLITYAVGIGCTELRFVYENRELGRGYSRAVGDRGGVVRLGRLGFEGQHR